MLFVITDQSLKLTMSTLFQLPMYRSPHHITHGWLSASVMLAFWSLNLFVSSRWTFTISIVPSNAELGVIVRVKVPPPAVNVVTNQPLAKASALKPPISTLILPAVLFLTFTATLTLPLFVVISAVKVQVSQVVCSIPSSVKVHHVPTVRSEAEFSNFGCVSNSLAILNKPS